MSPGLYSVPMAYCWRRKETWETRRKRSGTLGNSYWGRQADVCASFPRALNGVHAFCHGFTVGVNFISYSTAFHMGVSSIWIGCLCTLYTGLLSKSDFTVKWFPRAQSRSFSMEVAILFTLCRCHIHLCLGSVWSSKSLQYDRETLLVTKQFGWC